MLRSVTVGSSVGWSVVMVDSSWQICGLHGLRMQLDRSRAESKVRGRGVPPGVSLHAELGVGIGPDPWTKGRSGGLESDRYPTRRGLGRSVPSVGSRVGVEG